MRNKLLLAAAAGLTIGIVAVWAGSTDFATNAGARAAHMVTIDTYDLHFKAKVADLPILTIEDLN